MKNQHSQHETIWSRILRFVKNKEGQVTVIFALSLPAMVGIGALAVDGGQLYVARNIMQNAADAGARAGTAVLAEGGTQAEAAAKAVNFANQNLASVSYFTGAAPVVTFPTAQSVQVSISHDVPLVLAPALGINSAAVATSAKAEFFGVRTIGPGQLVPFGIYCNDAGDCTGSLAVGQILTVRRYCGDFFKNGKDNNKCGDNIADGEKFYSTVKFEKNSKKEFEASIVDGYQDTITLGQFGGEISDDEMDSDAAMQKIDSKKLEKRMDERLAEGRNEMVLPVIREASDPEGKYNIAVADFIMVRVSSFTKSGKASQITFEIIRIPMSMMEFAEEGEGLGINSVVGVRITG